MRLFVLVSAFVTLLAWGQTGSAESYKENFEDGLAQLWEPQVAAQRWRVIGSLGHKYKARASARFNGNMVSTYGGAEYANFNYSVSLRNKGVYASYMIFRATPDFSQQRSQRPQSGSGYAFGIDDHACVSGGLGKYYIYKMENGSFSTIKDWTESPYIKCDKQWNRLRVRAIGDTLKFFINGKLVYEFTDNAALLSGRIGLLGYSYTATPTRHYFDNIVVAPIVAANASDLASASDAQVSREQRLLNEMPSDSNNPAGYRPE